MAKSELEQLAELKAKLLAIIDEYKTVSKEKNKEFEASGFNLAPPRAKFFCVITDNKPAKNPNGEWTVKRTITKFSGNNTSGHSNIFANNLGTDGEPVLIVTGRQNGDLPKTAKFDAANHNLAKLAQKLAATGKNSYSVDLIWKSPNPSPNPELPKKDPYHEFIEQKKKEYEQKIELIRKNKHLYKPELNENIFLDIPFADNDKEFQNPQVAFLALRDVAATIYVYKNDMEFQKLTIEIIITTPMFSTDTVGFSLTYKFSQLMEERASTVRSTLILLGIPNAANIKITPQYNVRGVSRFLFRYVKP